MPKELYEKYNFRLYIHDILKQIHPSLKISQEAINEVNLMLHHFLETLMDNINRTINHAQKVTVTSRTVQTAVRLTLPGELAQQSVNQGTKALTKYTSSSSGVRGNKISQSTKAGLTFPISRIAHLMRFYMQHCNRLGRGAPVYLTAVIEYICSEILQIAGNIAIEQKRIRIRTRELTLAINNDEQLNYLCGDVTMSGGVIPYIHQALLPPKKSQ
jgi:histone H2A